MKSGWDDWSGEGCFRHGEYLINECNFWLKTYMLEHSDFPEPIIVLDNRDDHIQRNYDHWKSNKIPDAYVLMEGHLRFNLFLYLHNKGQFTTTAQIWLMTLIEHQ